MGFGDQPLFKQNKEDMFAYADDAPSVSVSVGARAGLVSGFGEACNQDAYEKAQRNVERDNVIQALEQGRAASMGQLDRNQLTNVSSMFAMAATQKNADDARKRSKEAREMDMYLNLLDEIRVLNDEIEALEDSLKDKYGDDVVLGMAETYLTEEERQGLTTPAEFRKAMADKYLDENGNVKPEFEGKIPEDELALFKKWREMEEKAKQANDIARENDYERTEELDDLSRKVVVDNDVSATHVYKQNLDNEVALDSATDAQEHENLDKIKADTGLGLDFLST